MITCSGTCTVSVARFMTESSFPSVFLRPCTRYPSFLSLNVFLLLILLASFVMSSRHSHSVSLHNFFCCFCCLLFLTFSSLLEPQSRFGGKTAWNLTGLPVKRDSSTKGVMSCLCCGVLVPGTLAHRTCDYFVFRLPLPHNVCDHRITAVSIVSPYVHRIRNKDGHWQH